MASCDGITGLRHYELGFWQAQHFARGELSRYSGIPAFRHSGIPVFRHSGIPVFRYSGIPAFRYSGIPVFRHSGIPVIRRNAPLAKRPIPSKTAIPAILYPGKAGSAGNYEPCSQDRHFARGKLQRHYGITNWDSGRPSILPVVNSAGIPVSRYSAAIHHSQECCSGEAVYSRWMIAAATSAGSMPLQQGVLPRGHCRFRQGDCWQRERITQCRPSGP